MQFGTNQKRLDALLSFYFNIQCELQFVFYMLSEVFANSNRSCHDMHSAQVRNAWKLTKRNCNNHKIP